MSLVMRELKKVAIKYDCAILIVLHTRKGGDLTTADAISGASAIKDLARRAIMPVTMTDAEAKAFGILPSQRRQYFKLVDAKSNRVARLAISAVKIISFCRRFSLARSINFWVCTANTGPPKVASTIHHSTAISAPS